jgi:hypothetical protein
MKTMKHFKGIAGILLWVLALAARPAQAVVTNGWSDSFEPYAVGTQLQATNGWSSARNWAGWVTNPAPETLALTNTYASGHPLVSASHTNLAAVADLLDNNVTFSTGGVVVVDLVAMPTWSEVDPPGETNLQCALYVKTNQHVVVWQYSPSATTNKWQELTASPLINTGVWTRFTMVQNYSNNLFQVLINNAAVSDAAGYAADGITPNGPWFHMVQTNGLIARVTLGDSGTNYVDDVVVSRRTLSWNPTGFAESTTNNGAINNSAPVVVTLQYDTFTNAADLTGFVQVDSGLPPGLSLVATRTSATTVALTLTNAATAHESINSVNNLTLHFLNGAFSLGNAADVTGSTTNTLSVSFRNTGVLSYSAALFQENGALNNGSFDPSTPVNITLVNDVFTGNDGEDYAANPAKLLIAPALPSGLTAHVAKVDSTHLQMTLLGNAGANSSADNTSFNLTFQPGAFASNAVASLVVNNTTNIQIQFTDAPQLTYSTNVFAEMPANDGSVTGTTVALQFDHFAGTNGQDLAASGFVSATLPSGLTLKAIQNSLSQVTLSFLNQATAHAAGDSWNNTATIHFLNGAFAGGNSSVVVGANRTDLSVVFHDPPVLSMPGGLVFTESAQNNGSIRNTVTISLSGDTFAADLTGRYAVNNAPAGLVPQLTRTSDTQVTLALTQNASPHTVSESTSLLQLVFSNEAFSTVAASHIVGTTTNFTVNFANAPTLTYSGTTFNELSFGTINNNTPITITLSGDTFVAAPGGDFSSWVSVANLPSGLTAVFTRTSGTQLSVTLSGIAGAHAALNTLHDLGFTFLQGAFANADANQVATYTRSDLTVVFVDDLSFINTIPYRESFEGYPNGFLLAGTNAWTADYFADAAQVTNGAALSTLLAHYQSGGGLYPITTNHTQVLLVSDTIRNEIHSPTGALVYLDFMMLPLPLQERPDSDTNLQFAFFVNTNEQLVVWHRNTTGGPSVNEWLVLSNNAPVISTNTWSRFTVTQNYTNMMFQIQVNELSPIVDPAGWDATGLIRTGSWFHMVHTNAATMSRLIVDGAGSAFLDDLTVVTSLPSPFGVGVGSIYKIR